VFGISISNMDLDEVSIKNDFFFIPFKMYCIKLNLIYRQYDYDWTTYLGAKEEKNAKSCVKIFKHLTREGGSCVERIGCNAIPCDINSAHFSDDVSLPMKEIKKLHQRYRNAINDEIRINIRLHFMYTMGRILFAGYRYI